MNDGVALITSPDTRRSVTPRLPLGRAILAGLAILLGLAAQGPCSILAAAESASETQGVEARLAELEALVAQLRAEIQALREAGSGAAPSGGAPATVAELQKRVDALALEIERLRIGEAAAPAAGTRISGFGPAASKIYGIRRGVSIGGYGEMLYQNHDTRADDGAPS